MSERMTEKRLEYVDNYIREVNVGLSSSEESANHWSWCGLELLDEIRALKAEVREKDERIKELEPDAWKIEATINMAVADLKAEVARLQAENEEKDEQREQRCIAHAAYNPDGDCIYCDFELATEKIESLESEVARLREALGRILLARDEFDRIRSKLNPIDWAFQTGRMSGRIKALVDDALRGSGEGE